MTHSTFWRGLGITLLVGSALANPRGFGGDAEAQEVGPAGTYAFQNVRVVSADEGIVADQTVVVRDGEILEVGPASSVGIPDDAVLIPGEGRYLAPGLADMHGRLPAGDDPMRAVVLDEILFMFLANGVTSVRVMDGDAAQLELRQQIEAGDVLGPTLYVASPTLGQDSGEESGPILERVREYAEAGYDQLTVGSQLSQQDWELMVEAAGDVGIPFGGRVPPQVGIVEALNDGISTVDHLDGYLEATRRDGISCDVLNAECFRATDPEKLQQLASRTTESGTYLVPAQYLSHHLFGWNELLGGHVQADSVRTLPEFGYVPDSQRDGWVTEAWNRWSGPDITEESAASFADWRAELLGSLHRAGADILFGTHSPALFNVPGFSVHRELPLLLEAGLTTSDALQAATTVASRFVQDELGSTDRFGAVSAGSRADLILLEADPLESIEALREPVGVMVRGIWLSPETIDERMGEIAERYQEFEVD